MISLRKTNKQGAHVFTEAMNDIMFFLMLFFIIVATMKSTSAIKVPVPKSGNNALVTPSKNELVLSVVKDATGAIAYYIKESPIDPEALAAFIMAEKQKHPENETVVMIRMDKDLPLQNLVDVMSVTSKAGVKSLIATEK
ncbi:MAG: biopolymer transporter ExbD [Bacteroidetes bacterium]|nr:biopolymer transporter ExbD [Bacteroidota bacterium]